MIEANWRSMQDLRPTAQKVFWATWLGWMLDGFDASIYAYVLVSALKELLPASGIAASQSNIGFYGGLLFSCFMVGWACSMYWGWAADRYGRAPVLCMTVLVYSTFTAASGLATGVTMFAVFRFLTGFGIGGEWSAGTPLLHETVPEQQRVRLAGWLHSAAPTGLLLAALLVFLAGDALGWRGLFIVGILPALLVLFVRRAFPKPVHRRSPPSFTSLFAVDQRKTTWAAALMLSCAIFGLWSSNFWAPAVVAIKLTANGTAPARSLELGALAGIATNCGALVACLLMPWITTYLASRRLTGFVFFLGSTVSVVTCYGLAIGYLDSLPLFFLLLPLVGFFTNGMFGLFTIWLPEMFPSALRGSGSGFAFSLGRLLGAVGPAAIGMIAGTTGSLPLAISLLAAIYVVGLPFIALSPETSGRPLPA
ncbi:MFS transporter [Mesorhizobium abyssinicae]|uniref:MFS transporter n=1 Tax=Mesorhizobium abyssinicae TaxID=1209958 RepID=UPI00339702D4